MLRTRIEDALVEMGIPTNIQGFLYIVDAVEILVEKPNAQITKFLYPEIAEKRKTKVNRVERAIRYALEVARSAKGNFDAVERFIGFANCTNSASLHRLALNIKREMEEERSKIPCALTVEDIRKIVREEIREDRRKLYERELRNQTVI